MLGVVFWDTTTLWRVPGSPTKQRAQNNEKSRSFSEAAVHIYRDAGECRAGRVDSSCSGGELESSICLPPPNKLVGRERGYPNVLFKGGAVQELPTVRKDMASLCILASPKQLFLIYLFPLFFPELLPLQNTFVFLLVGGGVDTARRVEVNILRVEAPLHFARRVPLPPLQYAPYLPTQNCVLGALPACLGPRDPIPSPQKHGFGELLEGFGYEFEWETIPAVVGGLEALLKQGSSKDTFYPFETWLFPPK